MLKFATEQLQELEAQRYEGLMERLVLALQPAFPATAYSLPDRVLRRLAADSAEFCWGRELVTERAVALVLWLRMEHGVDFAGRLDWARELFAAEHGEQQLLDLLQASSADALAMGADMGSPVRSVRDLPPHLLG